MNRWSYTSLQRPPRLDTLSERLGGRGGNLPTEQKTAMDLFGTISTTGRGPSLVTDARSHGPNRLAEFERLRA